MHDNPGNQTSLTNLKDAMESETRSIGPAITSAVMNSMRKRAESCIKSGGGHMKNIIFKW